MPFASIDPTHRFENFLSKQCLHFYFQALSWPIASQLQRNEEMEIQVLAFNRFLNNRPLGSATLSLQRLLDESHIQLALSLIDFNGRPLKVRFFLTFSCTKELLSILELEVSPS